MTHFPLLSDINNNLWDAFAGAEKFPSGRSPQVWSEGDVFLIVDKNGIELNIGGDCLHRNMEGCEENYLIGYANAIATALEADRLDPRWVAALFHMEEI